MTSRERWLALLEGGSYDRVPLTYRATGEFTHKLMEYLGCESAQQMNERLHLDDLVTVGPKYVGPPLAEETDVYGVRYAYTEYAGGRYHDAVYHPLAQYNSVEQIEDEYQWPDPDWWDYSVIPAQLEGKEDWVVRGGSYEEFAAFKFLRGVEQGYLDLAMHPEIVHYCMDKLCSLRCEDARRIYEQIPGKVIWTWVAEDVGSQEGLMISLAHIKEFLVPYMRRMADVVHEGGAYAFHHSDGCGRDALPTMIEDVGIDVLEPVQWRCPGMERETLKELFGADIAFMGGMDNQITLVRGSIEEIKREVEDNIRILGAGGGYLLGPCHNIQVVTAPEKVVAMYDHAYECGRIS